VVVKDYVAVDIARYAGEADDVAGYTDVAGFANVADDMAKTDVVVDDVDSLTWC
jgi:hypothetical protein